jgi:SSS family transporter
MTPALVAILAYLLLQLGIGVWVSRRITSESDYLIAGRRLGYGLATFSIFATWFGSETVVGSAGTTYRDGVSLASAEPFGYGLCLILMGLIFAGPLWRRKLTTLADLFRQRFSVSVERTAAVILIPGSILWAAAQVRAFGQVLATSAPGLQIDTAIAAAAGFTMLYTVFGGLLADAITDLIQGVVLIVGLLVLLVAVLLAVPGDAGVTASVAGAGSIDLVPHGVAPLALLEEWAIPVAGSVIATELVGRVIATRTEKVARGSSLMAGGLYIAMGIVPLAIGLVGRAVVPGLEDAEQVVPQVAQRLLPMLLYAIFIGGFISAILSTVDSTLLVSSGLFSHNLIVPTFRVTSERVKVMIARAGVMTFGVIAWALAVRAEGVFALVEQASAFGSAGTLVTVSFGLFTRLGGPRTALATLLAGLLVYLAASYGGAPYPFLASLGSSLAVYLGGSFFERAR